MAEFKKAIEKIPPHNIEAEEAVLGSLLLDKEAMIKVADVLQPKDFYKDAHRLIYEAMLDLWGKRDPIDILSVTNRLKEKKQLTSVGGRSFLAELANTVPTASHINAYAEIVQKKSTLRNIIESVQIINKMAYEEDYDTATILDKAEQKIFAISQKYLKQNFIPLKDTLKEAFGRIDALHEGSKKLLGISSGFIDLDNAIAGFQPSDFILLAGRPSVGKSSLALDIARQAAVYSNVPVGIFSLEMSKEQVVDRLISAQSNVSLWKLKTGKLSKKDGRDFEKLSKAFDELSRAQIFIDDSPMLNINEIRTKSRKLQSERGIKMLIIDYLQLMEGKRSRDNRVQEVTEISRALKALARELQIPIIALSQLSRATESRTPAIPKLADLRESGSLEQDADLVLFIYRKIMDKGIKHCPEKDVNIAEIHIGKHRHGPVGGVVKLYFDSRTSNFKNLEKMEDDQNIEDNLEEDPF